MTEVAPSNSARLHKKEETGMMASSGLIPVRYVRFILTSFSMTAKDAHEINM